MQLQWLCNLHNAAILELLHLKYYSKNICSVANSVQRISSIVRQTLDVIRADSDQRVI